MEMDKDREEGEWERILIKSRPTGLPLIDKPEGFPRPATCAPGVAGVLAMLEDEVVLLQEALDWVYGRYRSVWDAETTEKVEAALEWVNRG
jgi:hypothetical protein